jgi:Ca2+-binding EF-hand superfamily protein
MVRLLSFSVKLILFFTIALARSAKSHDPSIPKHQQNVKDHYKEGEHNVNVDHESVLGSEDAAEEYSHLPPEEAKRRLRILAGKMDTNKDGMVDSEELTAWIHESLKQLDQDEVRERFPQIDLDKDGKLSWEEYLNDAFGEDWKEDEDSKEFMKEDERYFQAADRNLDGKLTPEEFAAFQRPENHEHMAESIIKVTMDERDKNKDGTLTFDEYMSVVDKNKDSEWYDMEKERFENEYDANKDGVLDKEEIHNWLAPDTADSAREEAAHLLKESDKDHDLKLTYDEIVEQHELWVGSEATAYGDHLHKKVEL